MSTILKRKFSLKKIGAQLELTIDRQFGSRCILVYNSCNLVSASTMNVESNLLY